jgi:hypothetical protein
LSAQNKPTFERPQPTHQRFWTPSKLDLTENITNKTILVGYFASFGYIAYNMNKASKTNEIKQINRNIVKSIICIGCLVTFDISINRLFDRVNKKNTRIPKGLDYMN